MSLLLQASWTWGPEGQGAILLVNCDRDTPWLPKEDCSDEKVYSKQGASGATLGGRWEHVCPVPGRAEGEAGDNDSDVQCSEVMTVNTVQLHRYMHG